MANNWWDKFLDLFTEEIESEESPQPIKENRKSARSEKVRQDVRQDRRPGRIEEVHRPVQPRMISQYPQRDQGTVPEIDDRRGQIPRKPRRNRQKIENLKGAAVSEKSVSRRRRTESLDRRNSPNPTEDKASAYKKTVERSSRRRRTEAEEAVQQEKAREKFTGVDFRASEVPSPVYGFRRRQTRVETRNIEGPVEQRAKEFEELQWRERQEKEQFEVVERAETKIDWDTLTFAEDISETPVEEKQDQWSVQETQQALSVDESSPQTTVEETTVESEAELDRDPDPELNNAPYIEKPTGRTPPPYNVMMLKSDRQTRQKTEVDRRNGKYRLPPLHLLMKTTGPSEEDAEWIELQSQTLSETFKHFNVNARVTGYTKGPAVTRFEVQPAPGEKVNKIKKLNDDLKLSLAVKDIRIEAPIPGTNSVGIEIPNRTSQPVYLREMIESRAFQESDSPLTAALGRDITGRPIVTDLRKMPHGLIGGATGSGKSVCINSLLISLLYKASPDEVKFILIDPKVVELAPFKEIPHLAAPVINDAKEAALALKWAVEEMERRYGLFVEVGARDIARYNSRAQADEKLPFIVIVIDELADLMMAAPHDVEESICRIAQKARACGIHLVLATQRPSVDVITGLIKANIPTRLAFSVSAQADSRTILDMGGAEKLLGHGDMLFVENGSSQSIRVQGNFVSDDEIDNITDYVKQQGRPDFLFEKEQLQSVQMETDDEDELFEEACFFVLEQGSASASSLQRKFRIGYNRAARLIDMMESRGMISGSAGSKPRDLLISEEEFLESLMND